MDEPNRIERLVGEIIGLRILVAKLLDNQVAMNATQDELMAAIDQYEVRSDTPEGADRIKACGKNMLQNFPQNMDEKIT